MSRNVVLWSGGLDSTVVLYDLLCNATQYYPVYAVTVQNYPQIHKPLLLQQKKARKNFLKKYSKFNDRVKVHEIALTVTDGMDIGGSGHPQAAFWLMAIVNFLQEGDTLYAGYIRGDDFWHIKTEYTQAFNSALAIRDLKGKVELSFPKEYWDKWRVLDHANKSKIPKSCYWFCEDPKVTKNKVVACRNCACCLSQAQAELVLKLKGKSLERLIETVD